MRNTLCLLLALLALVAAEAQPNPTNNILFRHIPADAEQVYDIHIASLIARPRT